MGTAGSTAMCTKGAENEALDSLQTRLLGYVTAGPRIVWDSGLTCSFLACLIFSFSGLFVKLTGGRVPVLEVCLVRSSISAGLSFILMYLNKLNWRLYFGKRQNLKLLFARGCCGACAMTTYYVALFLLPLGDAVTINLVGPPVTAVLARLLLKEPLGYRGGAGCAISLLGVLLVARPPFLFGGDQEWARSRSIGTAAGVASAVLGGGSSMTIRLIGGSEPAAVIALWFHCATMILSVFPLLAGLPNKPVLLSGVDGSLMLGVAGTSFVAQLLSTRGLQRCQAAKAAAMGFTQVIYSNIMGAVFFGDKLTLSGLLGTLLILSGVLLVTLRSLKSSSSSSVTAAAACAGTAGAKMLGAAGKDTDNDAAALLSDDYVPSHLAAAQQGLDEDVTAVAVIKRRADSSLAPKPRPGSPAGEGEQLLTARTQSAFVDAAAAPEDTDAEFEAEPGLLAQIAASAAAALGGELCPAASAASAMQISRQVSRQLATSRAMSQMSRQASQFVYGSPSAFMTPPGIPGLSALPWDWQGLQQATQQQQPAQQAQQQEGPAPEQQQEQPCVSQVAPVAAPRGVGGLKQALLLQEDSLPSSPELAGRSPARLDEQELQTQQSPEAKPL